MQDLMVRKERLGSISHCFSGLMELYELNYLNLRRLLPDTDNLGESSVSIVKGGLDLHYRLIEKCRYTLIFSLTYQFERSSGRYCAPDLQIRLYNDARVAEVISGVLHRQGAHPNRMQGYAFSKDAPINPVFSRWRLNRFLYKWLNFCLKQGHVFREPLSARRIQEHLYTSMRKS